MSNSVAEFYDQLADDYHLIVADWKAYVLRQAESFDRLIHMEGSVPSHTVLDCTCGIGTQAIGLALKGYTVHATDLSPKAVERARQEAANFGVTLTFDVADLRTLETQVVGAYDVVLSTDNALAHFMNMDDLTLALRNMASKISPAGLLVVGMRDYELALQEKPPSTLPRVLDIDKRRSITFQVWDWSDDGKHYAVQHFTIKRDGERWNTVCRTTELRAWTRGEMEEALEAVGLEGVRWHMPESTGLYQLIVSAHKS